MLAIVREIARLAGCSINQHEIGCVDVFVVVGMRDDYGERFAVGRNLRVGYAENLAYPGEIENFAGSGGDGQA